MVGVISHSSRRATAWRRVYCYCQVLSLAARATSQGVYSLDGDRAPRGDPPTGVRYNINGIKYIHKRT
jgi:hypothetical protein